MIRYCTVNEEHFDRKHIPALGHDYGTNGVCIRCEDKITLPTPDANAVYTNPENPASGIYGNGEEYPQYAEDGSGEIANTGRYQLSVDEYYEIELDSDGSVWFEFHVDGPGQFAVYSTQNTNNVTLSRYSASFAGTFFLHDATVLEDGNFMATVNDCTSTYYNVQWTATYQLTGNAGDVVKFHIVRIADEAWEAKTIKENVYATELNNTKAPDPEEGYIAIAFGTEADETYYFDETVGYYRLGTKNEPGEIIYVAITKLGAPIFGEGNAVSFTTLLDTGNPLTLYQGRLPSGDELVYDYASMFMKEESYGGTPGNNYQEFVNKDGLYPVTQELYKYLNRYVELKTSLSGEDAWLAACYYYELLELGSEGRPIEITEVGTATHTQYTKRTYNNYVLKLAAGNYTFNCTQDNIVLMVGGKTYKNKNGTFAITNLTFTVADGTPFTFQMGSISGNIVDITFTITEANN